MSLESPTLKLFTVSYIWATTFATLSWPRRAYSDQTCKPSFSCSRSSTPIYVALQRLLNQKRFALRSWHPFWAASPHKRVPSPARWALQSQPLYSFQLLLSGTFLLRCQLCCKTLLDLFNFIFQWGPLDTNSVRVEKIPVTSRLFIFTTVMQIYIFDLQWLRELLQLTGLASLSH